VGEVILVGLLVLVLLGFWLLGRHWSKVPPKPKPPRPARRGTDWRARARWFATWWTL
jgi:hypothetical protein